MQFDNGLTRNTDKIHTTALGDERVKRNLKLGDTSDVIALCKRRIESADNIERIGKNWYVCAADCVFTINANSYTIITAKIKKAAQGNKKV